MLYLQLLSLSPPGVSQVPVVVFREIPVEGCIDAAGRILRPYVDALRENFFLEDCVDAIRNLFHQGRHRMGLLVLHNAVKGFVFAVGAPLRFIGRQTLGIQDFLNLFLCARGKQLLK
jgi:hypothetical protein